MVADAVKAIKIFFCYAHEDEALRDQLEKHLSPLRRLRQITGWFDRDIEAGTDWAHEIETQIDEASIILLLVSPDFIYSDYCYSVEMQHALDRNKVGKAFVIPIILRPVQWEETPIGELQVLPTGGLPITLWPDRDLAFLDVVRGIRELVKTLLRKQALSLQETSILYPELANLSAQARSTLLPDEPLISPISTGKDLSLDLPKPSPKQVPSQAGHLPVSIAHYFAKTYISITGFNQIVHILFEIRATEFVEQQRLPLSLALVLNHSNSMKGDKLKKIKEFSKIMLDRLEPTDYISVVIFDNTSQVIIPSMPANDPIGMKAAIDQIRDTSGSATMSLGMLQGLNELRRWNIPNSICRLILLTDGFTTADSSRCNKFAKDAAKESHAVYPLGVGVDWNQDLLNSIGALSGGIPAELIHNPLDTVNLIHQRLLSEAVASINKVAAIRNATMTVRLPVGVFFSQIIKILPLFRELELSGHLNEIAIRIGDLEKISLQLILVELVVEPRPSGIFRIAQVEFSYDVPSLNLVDERIRDDVKIHYGIK